MLCLSQLFLQKKNIFFKNGCQIGPENVTWYEGLFRIVLVTWETGSPPPSLAILKIQLVCFTDLDPGSEIIFFLVIFDHFHSEHRF
jgi:hypothetical protein